jgi:hypothetical protein
VSKALFEKYGGPVIFQQSNPQEPVGAERQLFEEAAAQGKLEILDPALKASFWAYFTGPLMWVADPKKVDYSSPWWLEKK